MRPHRGCRCSSSAQLNAYISCGRTRAGSCTRMAHSRPAHWRAACGRSDERRAGRTRLPGNSQRAPFVRRSSSTFASDRGRARARAELLNATSAARIARCATASSARAPADASIPGTQRSASRAPCGFTCNTGPGPRAMRPTRIRGAPPRQSFVRRGQSAHSWRACVIEEPSTVTSVRSGAAAHAIRTAHPHCCSIWRHTARCRRGTTCAGAGCGRPPSVCVSRARLRQMHCTE